MRIIAFLFAMTCMTGIAHAQSNSAYIALQSVAGLTRNPTVAQLQTALGLGSAAYQPSTAFDAAGAARCFPLAGNPFTVTLGTPSSTASGSVVTPSTVTTATGVQPGDIVLATYASGATIPTSTMMTGAVSDPATAAKLYVNHITTAAVTIPANTTESVNFWRCR